MIFDFITLSYFFTVPLRHIHISRAKDGARRAIPTFGSFSQVSPGHHGHLVEAEWSAGIGQRRHWRSPVLLSKGKQKARK